jgi:hypothetical protein
MSIYKALQDKISSDPDYVVAECIKLLDVNPDDVGALFMLGYIYTTAERFGLAIAIFRRVVDLTPKKPDCWNNLGIAYHGLKSTKAMDCFKKAWGLKQTAFYAANIASAHLEQCEWDKAREWAARAISMDSELAGAHVTHGMTSLALNDWRNGWAGFNRSLGGKFRKELQFKEEGRWDGSPGKDLVIYGEQGLGDEILYASCVGDAAAISKSTMLECDPRLEGLFRRSFPGVCVYGTRRKEAPWIDNHEIDARAAIAALPGFFRNSTEDFKQTPWLTADPERRLQWRALFDSWGKKPKIGIAWSGGSRHNRPDARKIGLEAFRPLIKAIDADYVSLQYKDPTAEIEATGLPVKHYKRACETDDYDDTAALVAELDIVIGVHTSVHHLAGGLGTKSIILVPSKTLWLYANQFPWYDAKLFKQHDAEPWSRTIQRLIKDINDSDIRRF